jgi:hypothetical protein
MDTRECPRRGQRLRAVGRTGVILMALVGIAATSSTVVDALRWREQVDVARTALTAPSTDSVERVDAVVVLLRDALASIDTLKEASARDSNLQPHVANALREIGSRCAR